MITSTFAAHRLTAPVVVAGAVALVCVGVTLADPTTPGGAIPVCPSKALLGINCPGCGSSRMLYSLLHGDLSAALHFNALGLLALGALLYSYLAWTRSRVTGRTGTPWHLRRHAPNIVLAVVLIWFVIRNIPIAPFTGLRV